MLGELVRKLTPWGHAKFQRWCIPAVMGELAPKRLTELAEHIRQCVECRRFLENTAQSSMEVMPSLWEKRKPVVSMMPPEGMRARFLQRLHRQRMGQEETEPMVELELPLGERSDLEEQASGPAVSGRQRNGFGLLFRPAPIAALVAAASLFVVGYYTGARSKFKAAAPDKTQTATLANETIHTNTDSSSATKEQLLQLALVDLASARALAAEERRTLEEKIAASDARLASLEQNNANALQQSQNAEHETKKALEASRQENELLRKKIVETDAILASQDRRTQELQNELQIARSRLQDQDEQRLADDQQLAKGQLSELVTARNLHIVDVYDADGGGQRKASFGRVFYVEGKSLLFYAYDLQATRHAKANVVFHVWGGRAGTKEVTHSLGILRNEDAGQGLWSMTFDDPSVLAQINSVFVTAESANRRDLVPHGKRVLYAYLGNPPNHP